MSGQRGGGEPVDLADMPLDQQFRGIRIIGLGMPMGLLLFGIIVFGVTGSLAKDDTHSELTGAPSLILLGLVIGNVVGQFLIRRSFQAYLRAESVFLRSRPDPLREVMGPYRQYLIKGWGLMEANGLLACLSFMLAGAKLGIFVWGAVLVYFLVTIPTEDRARRLVGSAIDTA